MTHLALAIIMVAALCSTSAAGTIRLEAESGELVGTSVSAAREGHSGTGYVTGFDADGDYTKAVPCKRCKRKIINSEVAEVILLNEKGQPVRIDVKDFIQEDTAWYIKELTKARESS